MALPLSVCSLLVDGRCNVTGCPHAAAAMPSHLDGHIMYLLLGSENKSFSPKLHLSGSFITTTESKTGRLYKLRRKLNLSGSQVKGGRIYRSKLPGWINYTLQCVPHCDIPSVRAS